MNLTSRIGRRIITASAITAFAFLLPGAALASPPSHSSTLAPQCRASNTLVWLALAPNGAAGTIYYPVEFTNLGPHACSLYGFPGVSAITGSGQRIGPPAGRFTATPHRVTLQHNQSAFALLGIVQKGIIGGCHPATAAGLRVYPPNQKPAQVISNFTFSACKNKVFMHVYPVRAGIGVP